MTINPELVRQAMRTWTTGIAIVTSTFEGISHGMTVSSFTSVALVPPLVLVSLAQDTRTHALVQKAGIFAVTILAADQQEIANRFADSNSEYGYRFSGLETTSLVTGAPVLKGGLAQFDCRVANAYPVSTHTLFIGEVVAVECGLAADSPEKEGTTFPLVYHNRGYHTLRS